MLTAKAVASMLGISTRADRGKRQKRAQSGKFFPTGHA